MCVRCVKEMNMERMMYSNVDEGMDLGQWVHFDNAAELG